MSTQGERSRRLAEVVGLGIPIPAAAYGALDKGYPGLELLKNWLWSAHIWDRPHQSSWELNESALEQAQAAWDSSREFTEASIERAQERGQQQAEATQAAEREAKQAELDELTEELRERYLRSPGTTEESFRSALPELLEARARRAALDGDADEVESPISRREILSV